MEGYLNSSVKEAPGYYARSNVQHQNYSDVKMSTMASQIHVTGLWEGKSPVTGEVLAQMASNAENVSIWYMMTSSWDMTVIPVSF